MKYNVKEFLEGKELIYTGRRDYPQIAAFWDPYPYICFRAAPHWDYPSYLRERTAFVKEKCKEVQKKKKPVLSVGGGKYSIPCPIIFSMPSYRDKYESLEEYLEHTYKRVELLFNRLMEGRELVVHVGEITRPVSALLTNKTGGLATLVQLVTGLNVSAAGVTAAVEYMATEFSYHSLLRGITEYLIGKLIVTGEITLQPEHVRMLRTALVYFAHINPGAITFRPDDDKLEHLRALIREHNVRLETDAVGFELLVRYAEARTALEQTVIKTKLTLNNQN